MDNISGRTRTKGVTHDQSKRNSNGMTIEEVDKIINDLRNQIPNLQAQLHQAEGYKQALIDVEKEKKEEEEKPEVKKKP